MINREEKRKQTAKETKIYQGVIISKQRSDEMSIALNILWISLACIGSYLLGSIPFSVIIGNLATGKDLREYNIGNPGGFNAMITYGAKIGLTISFLDIAKGAVAIIAIDQIFSLSYFAPTAGLNVWHIVACILGPAFCVLGHNYTVWLKFKGGKGIGVLMGTLLYANPLVYMVYMIMTAIQTQGLKLPSRLSNIIAGIVVIPVAFFMPISPPWTLILQSWTAGSTGYAFITQGLLAVALWLAILPAHWEGMINALKGQEWSFSYKDGQKVTDDFDTIKDAAEKEE